MSSHLASSVLRRYLDESDALLSYEKEHLLNCSRCRGTLEALRENATLADRVLSEAATTPDMAAARAAIDARATARIEMPVPHATGSSAYRSRWSVAAAAAVALVALFAYAPFRAYAQSFLTIFQPRTVAQISLSTADVKDFHNLPQLRELGTVTEEQRVKAQRFTSISAAQRFAHQRISRPRYLPSSVGRSVAYFVSPPASMRFTFDARKAEASAAKHHMKIPAPPSGIDGATLTASSGTVIVQYYGTSPEQIRRVEHSSNQFPQNGVVVMEGSVPTVRSTHADARQIENYLLSLPNVPEDLKTQIRAIEDPSGTLPLPVLADKNTAKPIAVHGVRGLLIGDNTGIGSWIVWISRGKFYSVAGGFKADEIEKIAESMES